MEGRTTDVEHISKIILNICTWHVGPEHLAPRPFDSLPVCPLVRVSGLGHKENFECWKFCMLSVKMSDACATARQGQLAIWHNIKWNLQQWPAPWMPNVAHTTRMPKVSLSSHCVCLLAFNNTGQEFPKRKEDVSWVELIINHCRAEAENAR